MPLSLRRKSYDICVMSISVHVPAKEALNSGLFGLLGDALVQMVQTTDYAMVDKFSRLVQDSSAPPWVKWRFSGKLGDLKCHVQYIENWRNRFRALWLWNNLEEFEDLETPPRRDIWPEYRPSEGEFVLISLLGEPTKDHPWVKRVFSLMPEIRTTVMFRHCTLNCGRPFSGDEIGTVEYIQYTDS